MKKEVCFFCGRVIREFTLCLVATIRPQADLWAEPRSSPIITPAPPSIPDEIGHEAMDGMASSEPPHPGRPVVLDGTQEVTTGAGKPVSEPMTQTCNNPVMDRFYIEGQLPRAILAHYFHNGQMVSITEGDEVTPQSAGSPSVGTEGIRTQFWHLPDNIAMQMFPDPLSVGANNAQTQTSDEITQGTTQDQAGGRRKGKRPQWRKPRKLSVQQNVTVETPEIARLEKPQDATRDALRRDMDTDGIDEEFLASSDDDTPPGSEDTDTAFTPLVRHRLTSSNDPQGYSIHLPFIPFDEAAITQNNAGPSGSGAIGLVSSCGIL